jgi:hypothetical protein
MGISPRARLTRAGIVALCVVGLLAIVGILLRADLFPSAAPHTPSAEGGTCRASSATSRPPYANLQVSHDAYRAHSEPMLVENPNNPLDLVGGSKLFTDPAQYRFKIGYFSSFDGGCTWTDGGYLPGFETRSLTSDISFAFDNHNDVYAGVLYTGPGKESGIAVSVSRDGGKTFGVPVTVFSDPTGRIFNDKPWIAVDQTRGPHSGSVYVVWSYQYGGDCGFGNACVQELAFSRSSDGGKTFSPARMIEGNAPFCTNPATGRPPSSTRCDAVIGSIPVVEPDGTVAVASAYMDLMSGSIPTRMIATSSHDSGDTWAPPALVATISDVIGYFPPERYRNESLPAFACDARTGQLYLAWSDKRTGDADILLSTSRDHGETWSRPLRVNDDVVGNGALQFQPQLAVAPNGVVSVSFFDTRLDPQRKLIDVYLAQSADHGASFLKNVRITTQSWDPAVDAPVDSYGSQFIGDYQGLAADNQFVHLFWNDTRSGTQEIFTATVLSAPPSQNAP